MLTVGRRYANTDDHGRSITNLEYVTARAKGIPVYVFVMRSILDVVPVWTSNKEGNFASIVDSVKVFEFVSRLRDAGDQWVFPFDTAQDIVHILRTQLAYLFADALDLRKRAIAAGALAGKYRGLYGDELRLIIERPSGWEYLLVDSALRRELDAASDLRRDWQYRIGLGDTVSLVPKEILQRFARKNDDALLLAQSAERILERLSRTQ